MEGGDLMASLKREMSRRYKHRHGGKRIPNFVRPEEREERTRRSTPMFDSLQALFASARRKR